MHDDNSSDTEPSNAIIGDDDTNGKDIDAFTPTFQGSLDSDSSAVSIAQTSASVSPPPVRVSAKAVKCSASPVPFTPAKRSKMTPAGAVLDMAGAFQEIASQFAADGSDEHSTPKRRTAAICTATLDKSLSTSEKIQVFRLFCSDIAAADAYLAIEDIELRTEFIRSEIAL